MQVFARIGGKEHALALKDGKATYRGQGVAVELDAATFKMLEAEAVDDLADGSEVDLTLAAQMMVLVQAEEALPR